MNRSFVTLSLLLIATAAPAQRVSPALQQRLAVLGARLGQCHRGEAVRLARTRLTADQVADRALAACAPREAPIRAALVGNIGQARAQRVLGLQRQHWRQAIRNIVQQARFTTR